MPLEKRKAYHSYLVRCWVSAPGGASARFVVEAISEHPQRWGFETFDDMVAFLREKLLEQQPGQPGEPPSDT